jgi:NTE family protein
MLDEVDVITSVSGGSFTSAYYGLFGDRIFEDYEERFLRYDVDSYLFWQIMRPWNWFRLGDRSELAIELYNKRIFDNASFADMNAANGPLVMINSTDLGDGRPFTFVQPQFDLLCTDLSGLKVARAVTASSAVPVVFSPLTLRNYAGSCGFPRPVWLDEGLADRQSDPRRFVNAEAIAGYLEPGKREYIHLVDGGISDNLGLRILLDDIRLFGGIWKTIGELHIGRPRHIVVVVVDASTHPDTEMGHTPAAPSLETVVDAITDIQLHNYNFETVELMRESLKRWAQAIEPGDDGQRLQTHLIEITFDSIKDPQERHYFNQVETSLALDEEPVDRLIEVGARLLRESPDYQNLVRVLNGSATVTRENGE